MKKLLLILTILLSVLFISCSDDNNNNDNEINIGNRQRISVRDYSASGGKRHQFYYKDGGKLGTILETLSDGRINRYRFDYNSSGELIFTVKDDYNTSKTIQTRNYDYVSSNTVSVIEKEYNEGIYVSSLELVLTLDNKDRLIKEAYSNTSTTYEYDNNGNLLKRKDSYYTYSYTYDNKISSFSNQGLPAWYWVYDANEDFDLYAGSNNLVDSFSNGIKEDSYKYDYNKNGYPTTIYDSSTGKKIGEFAYEAIK